MSGIHCWTLVLLGICTATLLVGLVMYVQGVFSAFCYLVISSAKADMTPPFGSLGEACLKQTQCPFWSLDKGCATALGRNLSACIGNCSQKRSLLQLSVAHFLVPGTQGSSLKSLLKSFFINLFSPWNLGWLHLIILDILCMKLLLPLLMAHTLTSSGAELYELTFFFTLRLNNSAI